MKGSKAYPYLNHNAVNIGQIFVEGNERIDARIQSDHSKAGISIGRKQVTLARQGEGKVFVFSGSGKIDRVTIRPGFGILCFRDLKNLQHNGRGCFPTLSHSRCFVHGRAPERAEGKFTADKIADDSVPPFPLGRVEESDAPASKRVVPCPQCNNEGQIRTGSRFKGFAKVLPFRAPSLSHFSESLSIRSGPVPSLTTIRFPLNLRGQIFSLGKTWSLRTPSTKNGGSLVGAKGGEIGWVWLN
ncbi:MAG: hypothetical protein N3B10_13255 [Armatimonadetes bacterium]|nr:hypothetical protein [Armatimonadota bacterium]